MYKAMIPCILAVTLLLAGIFSVMPIEKAQTVHTSILAGTSDIISVTKTAIGVGSFNATLTCTSSYQLLEVYVYVVDAGAIDGTISVITDPDGMGPLPEATNFPSGSLTSASDTTTRIFGVSNGIATGLGGGVTTVAYVDAGADDTSQPTILLTASVGGGTCS